MLLLLQLPQVLLILIVFFFSLFKIGFSG